MKKIIGTLLIFIAINNNTIGQQKDMKKDMKKENKNAYSTLWQQASKYANKQLPKNENTIYEKIYALASIENNSAQKIKAILHLYKNINEDDENTNFKNSLLYLERELNKATRIEQKILNSYIATILWQNYNYESYNILERSNIDKTTFEIKNIETWNAQQYFDAISQYYANSLTNEALLLKTKASNYPELFSVGENTNGIRENLFEILAFRAVSFFKQDIIEITKPSYSFEIDDTRAFENGLSFCKYDLKTSDTRSNKYVCLSLYQKLMQLNIKNEIAFADIDIDRLQYVHEHCALENKDLLYVQALHQFETNHKAEAISGYAKYLIAEQLNNENFKYTYVDNKFIKNEDKNFKINKVQIKNICKNIIAKWPNTEGSHNATVLLNNLNTKELSIKTENCYLPNENILTNIHYKNIDKIFVKIIALPNIINNDNYEEANKKLLKLNKLKPIKTFEMNLPSADDGHIHNSDFKIDPLPNGKYALVFSTNNDFTFSKNCFAIGEIQVSNLNYFITNIGDETKQIFVLDRKTGLPINDATIKMYRSDYVKQKYELNLINKIQTNINGSAIMNQNNGNYLFSISKNNSIYIPQHSVGFYNYNNNNNGDGHLITNNIIFTDRSIYRPGQIIYFKAISTTINDTEKITVPNINTNLTIELLDPNYQIVQTLNLSTNKYGSIAGLLKAPQNLLPGNYTIRIGSQTQNINIEEYKRPKFEILFDTLQADYTLNKMVTIKGKVVAYAGNAVGDANIKYEVNRTTEFLYKWLCWPMPQSVNKRITQGTTKTNADGTFEITFMAQADNSIEKNTLPKFNFDINITATDLNGETHDANKTISTGYSDVVINIKQNDSKINITTQNNNGNFKATPIIFTVYKLERPNGNFRKKMWEAPNTFILSEKEFKNYFPIDEYSNEHKIENFKTKAALWQKEFTSSNINEYEVDKLLAQDGDYKLIISTLNNMGDTITDQIFISQNKANKPLMPSELITINTNKNLKPGNTAITSIYKWEGIKNIFKFYSNKYFKNETLGNNTTTRNKIENSDKGNIYNNYVYGFENRIYQHEQTLIVPYFNKDIKIELTTFRDKVEPGSQQEWIVKINGGDAETLDVELLANMYDASLDALKPHNWSINNFILHNYNNFSIDFEQNEIGFNGEINNSEYIKSNLNRTYNMLNEWQLLNNQNDENRVYSGINFDGGTYAWANRNGNSKLEMKSALSYNVAVADVAKVSPNGFAGSAQATMPVAKASMQFTPPILKKDGDVKDEDKPIALNKTTAQQPTLRKNFNETAFWMPQLHIDEQGNYVLKFTTPEALTKWKCMLYAHSTNLQNAYLEKEIITQKDLMVVPNTPRFMRQGDAMLYSFKVSNTSTANINGTATLQLIDAITNKNIDAIFGNANNIQAININANKSTNLQFAITIPADYTNPIIVKTIATAGTLSDGEQNVIPILSNAIMLTETMPYSLRAGETKSITIANLQNSKSSNTQQHFSYTIESTNNPAWYAVQALPYLQEFPHECAEQTFSRYYANVLATYIANSNPKIKKVFETWRAKNIYPISNLEKNQELKNILLQETPWVLQAKNETEQMQNIATLFDIEKMSSNTKNAFEILKKMQAADGSFAWFNGMQADRYITQTILSGMGKLQHLGIAEIEGNTENQMMVNNCILFLSKQLNEDYKFDLKNKITASKNVPASIIIHYLYARSMFKYKIDGEKSDEAVQYYISAVANNWTKYGKYEQALIAIICKNNNKNIIAYDIIKSLKQTAINSNELGMYWAENKTGYNWNEAPIETQCAIIEAFNEVGNETKSVDEMKLWLLKNKQTNNWGTTKATADACFAFINNSTNLLANAGNVVLEIDNKTIDSKNYLTNDAMGYTKLHYTKENITAAMGNVKASNIGSNISWGAIYYQYSEQLDKINSANTNLKIVKTLYKTTQTNEGKVLVKITDKTPLQIGDKLVAKLELRVDRAMQYVHLKDMRAACCEPLNVISTYQYQNGLGYYQATKDATTNFYFDQLPKGYYTFEYEMYVTLAGIYSNGIAQVQCMYAPEFSAHSAGEKIIVK
jgi:hypothetical protein